MILINFPGPRPDEGVPDARDPHREDDLQRLAPLQHAGESRQSAGQDHESGEMSMPTWSLFTSDMFITIISF